MTIENQKLLDARIAVVHAWSELDVAKQKARIAEEQLAKAYAAVTAAEVVEYNLLNKE